MQEEKEYNRLLKENSQKMKGENMSIEKIQRKEGESHNPGEMLTDNWQSVDEKAGLSRYKIPGGWIVRAEQRLNGLFQMPNPKLQGSMIQMERPINGMMSIIFYPDPEYKWEIGK